MNQFLNLYFLLKVCEVTLPTPISEHLFIGRTTRTELNSSFLPPLTSIWWFFSQNCTFCAIRVYKLWMWNESSLLLDIIWISVFSIPDLSALNPDLYSGWWDGYYSAFPIMFIIPLQLWITRQRGSINTYVGIRVVRPEDISRRYFFYPSVCLSLRYRIVSSLSASCVMLVSIHILLKRGWGASLNSLNKLQFFGKTKLYL